MDTLCQDCRRAAAIEVVATVDGRDGVASAGKTGSRQAWLHSAFCVDIARQNWDSANYISAVIERHCPGRNSVTLERRKGHHLSTNRWIDVRCK